MTKRTAYETIKSVMADNAEIVAFCDHEIELLDHKAASAKKAPKKPDAYIDTIYGVLTADAMTIDDIANAVGISNAKCSARLNTLVKDGKAVRGMTKVGKSTKVTFALA